MANCESIYRKIFASYMALSKASRDQPDCCIRQPKVLMELAARLDLIPPAERVIRVTGSKGKGTVSHFAARMIRAACPDKKVGLVVSPQELVHRDRMRVNGEAISEEAFIQVFAELEPYLARIDLGSLPVPYLSPSGLFLLMALFWFKRRGVDYFVIETGRGVRYDEAGNLPSELAVVSSVLAEHLDRIGPTLRDITTDKLSIARSSNWVMFDAATCSLALSYGLVLPRAGQHHDEQFCLTDAPEAGTLIRVPSTVTSQEAVPSWVVTDRALAYAAVQRLLPGAQGPSVPLVSPSFFSFQWSDTRMVAEGLISFSSLDVGYYSSFFAEHRDAAAILSVPDDKELQQLTAYFSGVLKIPVYHVILSSPGLSYALTLQHYRDGVLFECGLDDDDLLLKLDASRSLAGLRRLALLGTQSFMRVIKKSCDRSGVNWGFDLVHTILR